MKEIILPDDCEAYTTEGAHDPLNPSRLENLGKINILIGANNSGKSRLLRSIAKDTALAFEPSSESQPLGYPIRELKQLGDRILELMAEADTDRNLVGNRIITDELSFFENLTIQGIYARTKGVIGGISPLRLAIEKLEHARKSVDKRLSCNTSAFDSPVAKAVEGLAKAQDIEALSATCVRVYIPTLRSLRHLNLENRQDFFLKRTSEDYGMSGEIIFTGQTLYDEIESLLRGNLDDREALRSFETWLSETFFENQPIALIPKKGQNTLTVKIGVEHEKPIHELGDGIQSVLIMAFPLFKHQEKHLLAFIDEPELFLHPWLQRVFMETLSSKFPKHQYFLTTHSNHLLDLTVDFPDVSVFTCEKQLDPQHEGKEKPPRFTVRQVSLGNRTPLELLGVRNSSVFLSNCTLWVEGITDRRHIAHWLKLYQEGIYNPEAPARIFREDLHYSFVEYGGGNITHFSFLDDEDAPTKGINVDRLCAKLFLIADKDGPNKQPRHEQLERHLKERYFCLPGREIENLIKPEVLQRILVSYKELNPEIWDHALYLDKLLGKFIETQLGPKRQRRGSYQDNSGTIQDKKAFCQKAILATKTWSDVSIPAQKLVERLYTFISQMNPQ